jgi:polar amino acid transport system permease protein
MNYVFQFGEVFRYWPLLAQGAAVTLALSIVGMIAGLVIGTLCALARRSENALARIPAACYVEIIRNTPLLVQAFIIFFGLPGLGIRLDSNIAAIIALVINNGAYTTEIVRSGIEAIHRSQFEAGLSIGMSRLQVFVYVVARPAFEKVYPALCSQFIILLLGSSVVSAIGADELTAFAHRIQSANFRSLEVYIVCMFTYLGLAFLVRGGLAAIGFSLFSYRRHIARTSGA